MLSAYINYVNSFTYPALLYESSDTEQAVQCYNILISNFSLTGIILCVITGRLPHVITLIAVISPRIPSQRYFANFGS